MKPFRGLTDAGSAINKGLQNLDIRGALRPHMAKVKWADAVGPQISAVTQVESVRPIQDKSEFLLTVRAKNSVWANELTLLKPDMIRKLNLALGGHIIGDIRFKASGLAKVPPPAVAIIRSDLPDRKELDAIILSADAQAVIDLKVAAIREPTLQASVRRTLANSAKLTQWKVVHGWKTCVRCAALTAPNKFAASSDLCMICNQAEAK